jgi:RHS repeat-associated protein
VFGAPRTTTGTTANDFLYTGQQDDRNANRGLYFLRARSYDPALGRFLQQDPLPLKNRYAYAGNNAANLMDPSGNLPCPGCGKIRRAASTAVDEVASVITDGKLGYVDLNFTFCYGVCFTGGVQWQVGTTEWHRYVGAGVGSPGGSLTATFAPFQTITTGWSCGAQFTGGGYSYQFGRPVKDKEGSFPLFVEGGRGFGNGISVTCFYVF